MCVVCKYENDAATAIGVDEKARPKPGDVNICLNCGLITLYGPDLQPRSLTKDELAQIPRGAFVASAAIRERGRFRFG